MTRWVVAGLWLLAGWASAQDQTRRLVEQLADPDFTIRESAHRQLLELGAPAATALEAARHTSDVEQRLRIESLLNQLQRDRVWSASTVRLQRPDAEALDLYQQIEKQTGNRINWGHSPQTIVGRTAVDWTDREYWPALDELGRRVNVVAHHFDDPLSEGLVLKQGTPGQFPVAYQGPLKMILLNAQRSVSQTFDFDQRVLDDQSSLSLAYAAYWEQHLHLCRYASKPTILTALTDSDEELRIEPRAPNDAKLKASKAPLAVRRRQMVFTSRLNPPTKPARLLKELVISLDLVAASAYEAVELTELKSGQTVTQSGYELTCAGSKLENNAWTLMLDWRRPAPLDAHNATDWVDEHLEILDAAGKKMPFIQQRVEGDKESVRYTVQTSDRLGPPTRVRFQVGRLRSERNFQFRFTDVPLPASPSKDAGADRNS